jgi:hypothetical protein
MRFWTTHERDESWKQMHHRVIQETEQFLTECLRHPELAVRIPAIPAGSGRFPRSMTTAFWSKILDE